METVDFEELEHKKYETWLNYGISKGFIGGTYAGPQHPPVTYTGTGTLEYVPGSFGGQGAWLPKCQK